MLFKLKELHFFLINRNSALFYPLRRPLYSYNHFLLKEINRNKKAICGMKIRIPMPGMIPWETKLVNTPAGSSLFAKVLNEAKVLSIKSIGTLDHSKID
jgi:hypothetical protein